MNLELGGKTPMIVFNDADLDTTVPLLVAAVTTFAGQFCMTGSPDPGPTRGGRRGPKQAGKGL